jgi:hypothetical protein
VITTNKVVPLRKKNKLKIIPNGIVLACLANVNCRKVIKKVIAQNIYDEMVHTSA